MKLYVEDTRTALFTPTMEETELYKVWIEEVMGVRAGAFGMDHWSRSLKDERKGTVGSSGGNGVWAAGYAKALGLERLGRVGGAERRAHRRSAETKREVGGGEGGAGRQVGPAVHGIQTECCMRTKRALL